MKLPESIHFGYPILVRCISVISLFVLVACNSDTATLLQATAILPQPTTTSPQVTPTATLATATPPLVSLEPAPFSLSEPGQYQVGRRRFTFVDANREDREIVIIVWYPALRTPDSNDSDPTQDADPDLSAGPYPLILSSSKSGGVFAPHLASHGFVVAGLGKMDSADRWGRWLIDYPLDILFALDQIASDSLSGLEGMIDANLAGAMGYSFDGYNALALSGARINPEFYLTQCSEASTMEPVLSQWWVDYLCDMVGEWEDFVASAGDAITVSDDGLWQPMTDERIRAVMPMAPEGAWLFGEIGLAAVNRPTLIIGATKDTINFYDLEAVYIFEHLGTPDRFMISFIGEGHMMIYDAKQIARMKHFATAFFGYYLQGHDNYAEYFSEDFVAENDALAWGVYESD